MQARERSVLHVLPHPRGGGETYVDLLGAMPGYRSSRIHLTSSQNAYRHLARGVAGAYARAREHDLVHVHGEIAAGLCLPLLATRPSVVTLHGLHLVRRLHGLPREAAALNLRALLRAADRTICVSNAEHAYLTSIVGPLGTRRAVVVRNGVRPPPPTSEEERRKIRAELGLADSATVAIWVGSLDERKDPLAAIRAAERATVTLLVVGDGPLRREVVRTATRSVHVLGGRGDVPRLLGAADLFVLTSHREGLAYSLLEAMSFGLPAVVTDLAENVEAIGDTGVAVPVGDEHALAEALGGLTQDAAERARLGERARNRVVAHFDTSSMVSRTRIVYDDVRVSVGADAP